MIVKSPTVKKTPHLLKLASATFGMLLALVRLPQVAVLWYAILAAGYTVIPALFTSDSPVIDQAHVLWPWLVLMMPLNGCLLLVSI
jgi:hypothetical protein